MNYYKHSAILLSKACYVCAIVILFLGENGNGKTQKTLQHVLQEELTQNKITEAEAIAYKLMAIQNSDLLPEFYKEFESPLTRSGTTLRFKAKAMLPKVAGQDRKNLISILLRPSREKLPEELISPKGYFKIHYATEGRDASTMEYIEETARTFDAVYEFEVNNLGFARPPDDYDVDGPEYDVYVHNIYEYGYTTADRPVVETSHDDYTSWIEIDNDFTHTPTKGLDAMRVTAAHEFFHMIQIGYRSYTETILSAIFLFESTATWMEDMVFDDVNDYYNYLTNFFEANNNSNISFSTENGEHEYGLSLYHHMLEKKYGYEVLKRMWENFKYNEVYQAMDAALIEFGSNFSTELMEFNIWNVFTGDRADSVQFYSEGVHYPMLEPVETFIFNDFTSFDGEIGELASQPYKLVPQISSDFSIQPTLDEPFAWSYGIVTRSVSGDNDYFVCNGDFAKNLPYTKANSEIWLLPTNITIPQTNNSFNKLNFKFDIKKGKTANLASSILLVAPNPFLPSKHNQIQIKFNSAKPAGKADLIIVTESGRPVRKISHGSITDGLNIISWDGRDEDGMLMPSGVYLFYVESEEVIGPGKLALIN